MPTPSAARPIQATLFSVLLLVASLCMVLLGLDASGYYVPALCLLLQATLLWRGRGLRLFRGLMWANLISGSVLILVLWLGDALRLPKLDIAGVMLLGNLLSGGPLMAVLSVPLLLALRCRPQLPRWFSAAAPREE